MKQIAPVLALALLAPFVAEILLGATPLSRFASLPPLVLLHGGGAVSIREFARRTHGGWSAILCLGAAYALVEEGLVMQTIFHPALFGAAACGGRFAGVNWVWTEALAGYHMVWSIAIPIALAELCFPERREEPWLGRAGVSIAVACYAAGALSISVVFRRFIVPGFRAPSVSLVVTAIVAAALVLATLRRQARPVRPQSRAAVPCHLFIGLVALMGSGLWLLLFLLPPPLRTGLRVLAPMFLEACLAVGVYLLVRRWSASASAWTDSHRLALIAGALLANSTYGVYVIREGTQFDRVGQAASCVLAVVCLVALARRIRRRFLSVGHHVASAGTSSAPIS